MSSTAATWSGPETRAKGSEIHDLGLSQRLEALAGVLLLIECVAAATSGHEMGLTTIFVGVSSVTLHVVVALHLEPVTARVLERAARVNQRPEPFVRGKRWLRVRKEQTAKTVPTVRFSFQAHIV